MAKINFGGIVQDARGKQNGLVYSKNKSGAYVRRKVSPVQPNSTKQTNVRNNFGVLAKDWSGTLTQEQRDAWIAFAPLNTLKDVFGNTLVLNGLNWYIRLNQVLKQIGQPGILIPPSSTGVTPIPIDSASFSITDPGEIYQFDQTAPAASGSAFYIEATPPMAPGRTSNKSFFRFIGQPDSVVAPYPAQVQIGDLYRNTFGEAIDGKRVDLRVSTVNTLSGVTSVGVAMSTIAVFA